MTDNQVIQIEPSCNPLLLYVNDDDDNRDGIADNATTNVVSNENDMYRVEVIPLFPTASPLEARIQIEGAQTARAYGAVDHTQPISSNAWTPVSGSNIVFWLEGLRASGSFAGSILRVDVRTTGSTRLSPIKIAFTSYGITAITFSDGSSSGNAPVGRWSDLPMDTRPTGFAASNTDHYYCDPGVIPHVDDPIALSPGGNLWQASTRNRVGVRVTVKPVGPIPVKVWVSSRDVDDVSYPLWGDAGQDRREFMDPLDRGPSGFLDSIRTDNNDMVSIGASLSPHGALLDGGALKSTVERSFAGGDLDEVLVVTFAPGDNFRVIASLAADILGAGSDKIVVAVPGDFQDPYAESSERAAAVVYRIAAGEVRQALASPATSALIVPEATPVGHQCAVSRTLTVRRRLWIEELNCGTAPESWNLTCNVYVDNASPGITRFVVDSRELPGFPGHSEWRLRYNDDRYTAPAPFPADHPLQRHVLMQAYNSMFSGCPHALLFPGAYMWEIDNSTRALWWGTPASLGTFTFASALAAGALGSWQVIPQYPFGFGAFAEGEVRSHAGAIARIKSNSNDGLWVVGPPSGGPPVLPLEWQAPGGGAWTAFDAARMELDPTTGDVTVTPSAPFPVPPAQSTRVRTASAHCPPGWSQECLVTASSALAFTLAPSPAPPPFAGTRSFRVPIMILDDTSAALTAAGGTASHYDGLGVQVSKEGRPPVNYAAYMLRDTLVSPEQIGGAYTVQKEWHKHTPLDMQFGWPPAVRQLYSMAFTDLRFSRLMQDRRLSNERCWTSTLVYTPDYLVRRNLDPYSQDSADNEGGGSWANAIDARLKLVLPDVYPTGGLPVFTASPWTMADMMVAQGHAVYAYDKYNLAGASNHDVYKAQYIVHELMHLLLPLGVDLPEGNDPAQGMQWNLYAPILVPGDGSNQLGGLWTGHHGIPGVTSYYPTREDPVASPTNEVAYPEDVWGAGTAGKSECIVSPYAIRWLREKTIAPRYETTRPW